MKTADRAHGASLGGEDSGHLIFLHHHTTGDGIITALQVAAAMKKEDKPLALPSLICGRISRTLIRLDHFFQLLQWAHFDDL